MSESSAPLGAPSLDNFGLDDALSLRQHVHAKKRAKAQVSSLRPRIDEERKDEHSDDFRYLERKLAKYTREEQQAVLKTPVAFPGGYLEHVLNMLPQQRRLARIAMRYRTPRLHYGFGTWASAYLDFCTRRQEAQAALEAKRQRGAESIQRVARGRAGRARYTRVRVAHEAAELREKTAMIVRLQCLARVAHATTRVKALRFKAWKTRMDDAPRRFQRVWRGHAARGRVRNLLRLRLLELLREWGNGSASAVVELPGLPAEGVGLLLLAVHQTKSAAVPWKQLPSRASLLKYTAAAVKIKADFDRRKNGALSEDALRRLCRQEVRIFLCISILIRICLQTGQIPSCIYISVALLSYCLFVCLLLVLH
jgi:hypothetical protein